MGEETEEQIGKFKEELVEPYIDMGDYVCPNDIEEIIELAKKEFPRLGDVPQHEDESYGDYWFRLGNMRTRWFVRWFGDEK